MRTNVVTLAFLALVVSSSASFIIYGETLQEFITKRDIVFKGVVTKLEDTKESEGPSKRQTSDEPPPPVKIATIEIREVLKNRKRRPEIRESREIQILVSTPEVTIATIPWWKVGFEGFWILDSSEPNYGYTSRAVHYPNFEELIREATK